MATDPTPLERLLAALSDAEATERTASTRATSLRLAEAVHRAAMLATELGMDPSLTVATTEALLDRVRRFARAAALAQHLADFPDDEPQLADVALRRASGTEHPAAMRPGLVRAVAELVAESDERQGRGRVGPRITGLDGRQPAGAGG